MCCQGLIEKLPQLNACCCCCKVETGSKIIAWLDVIAATSYIILAVIAVVGGGAVNAAVITAAVVLIIAMVCMFLMALVLLLGLYREERSKVELWLRLSCCLLFFIIASEILNVISAGISMEIGGAISTAISALIVILYKLYMISVVKSHYHNMINGFEEGRA